MLTLTLCERRGLGRLAAGLDVDHEGRLLGIEVGNPRRALRPEYFRPDDT
jgi:hypothetical protein